MAPSDTRITIGIPNADAPTGPLVSSLTHTSLIRVGADGRVRPGLVVSWDVSPDQRVWTLAIRPGVRLHNGSEATTANVRDLIQETVDEGRSPGLWPVTSVDVVDPTHVRVTLSEPSSFFLEGLALVRALNAGPYRTDQPDADLPTLEAARREGEPVPAITTIELQRYDSPRAAIAALLRDEVDVLYELPDESRNLLASEPGVRIYPHFKPYVVAIGLNHRHPILRNRNVRRAMSLLVDRQALVAEDAGGSSVPAIDPISLQHWTRPHTADAEALRVDPERAFQLLDAAGYPARQGADGRVGSRFSVHCLLIDDPTVLRVATRLQQIYATAGIGIELEPMSLAQFGRRLAAGDFETFLSPVVSGFGLGMLYAHYGDHDNPRTSNDGYRAAQAALERVKLAPTPEALTAAVGDLHRVLLEDPPAIYLYWQQTNRVVGPGIRVPADVSGDVLLSLPLWERSGTAP